MTSNDEKLKQSDETIQENCLSLISEGNNLFKSGEFLWASQCYTNALKLNHYHARTLLNRSMTYLKMGMFFYAHRDARLALNFPDVDKEKAYYRKAKAEYLMRKFLASKKTFDECLTLNPNNKEAQEGKDKAKKRIKETITGEFDFEYMIKNSGLMSNEFLLRLDVADFKSDLIEIVEIPNKSKGVMSIKDIKKGTLLVVSKAFSITYDVENDGKSKPLYSDYLYRNNMQSQQPNVIVAVEAIESNPYLAKEFYSLYAGPKFDRNISNSTNKSYINIPHILSILDHNAFSNEHLKSHSQSNNKSSGLWILPSYFNHSCCPNLIRIFFSDVMLIYAKYDIKAGEELNISYIGFESCYESRQLSLKAYEFECSCPCCQLDKKEAINLKNERQEILKKVDEIPKLTSPVQLKVLLGLSQKYAVEMRKTYESDVGKIRHEYDMKDLFRPLQKLAMLYKFNTMYWESAECLEKIYYITRENYDDNVFLWSLLEAFVCFKKCSTVKANEKAEWCLKEIQSFFIGNKPYFDFILNNAINTTIC